MEELTPWATRISTMALDLIFLRLSRVKITTAICDTDEKAINTFMSVA